MPPSPLGDLALDADLVRGWPLRHEGGDKLERGTVLVIGGSAETPGAAVLAGLAALRMGAGRLQIATDADVAKHVAVTVPEARVVDYDDLDAVRSLVSSCDAVVVGPGLVGPIRTQRLLQLVLDHRDADVPTVVDAGALPAFAELVPADAGGGIVLTPNHDELAIFGDGAAPPSAREVAVGHGVTVASFGRVATAGGRCWVDDDDVDGLGTSGSGDVLAGAIGGAAARSGDAVQAACWAIYAHRCAGSRLAQRVGPVGYLARELADELPAILADITAGRRGDEPRRSGAGSHVAS